MKIGDLIRVIKENNNFNDFKNKYANTLNEEIVYTLFELLLTNDAYKNELFLENYFDYYKKNEFFLNNHNIINWSACFGSSKLFINVYENSNIKDQISIDKLMHSTISHAKKNNFDYILDKIVKKHNNNYLEYIIKYKYANNYSANIASLYNEMLDSYLNKYINNITEKDINEIMKSNESYINQELKEKLVLMKEYIILKTNNNTASYNNLIRKL